MHMEIFITFLGTHLKLGEKLSLARIIVSHFEVPINCLNHLMKFFGECSIVSFVKGTVMN